MPTLTRRYQLRSIDPEVAATLRRHDDLGETRPAHVDAEGGSPLRCCLRRAEPGEVITLVSSAVLRRWAVETGAHPGTYDEVGPVFIHAGPCAGPVVDRLPLVRAVEFGCFLYEVRVTADPQP
jgi:hypothetical protein